MINLCWWFGPEPTVENQQADSDQAPDDADTDSCLIAQRRRIAAVAGLGELWFCGRFGGLGHLGERRSHKPVARLWLANNLAWLLLVAWTATARERVEG